MSATRKHPCCLCSLHTTRAIRVDGLTNCVVYTGAVAGSVLLHKCSGCTLMLASRQIRLHTSTDCDFYLHVHSRPIIEHCERLRFAPYPLTHGSLETDLTAAGLKPVGDQAVAHLWREVDDFNWHKVQASPHWSVLPASQRATTSAHSSFQIDWSPHAEYVSGKLSAGAKAPDGTSADSSANSESKGGPPTPASHQQGEDTPQEAAAGAGAPAPAPAAADSDGESDDEL